MEMVSKILFRKIDFGKAGEKSSPLPSCVRRLEGFSIVRPSVCLLSPRVHLSPGQSVTLKGLPTPDLPGRPVHLLLPLALGARVDMQVHYGQPWVMSSAGRGRPGHFDRWTDVDTAGDSRTSQLARK